MLRITIDIDDAIEDWLKSQAKGSGLSIDNWVLQLLREESTRSQWRHTVSSLSGAWPDYPDIEQLRANTIQDSPRETF